MKRDELSSLIRELLAEELAALKDDLGAPQVREEYISIRSESDLNGFARRILALSKDSAARADIEAGRHVFRLAAAPSAPRAASATVSTPPAAKSQASDGFSKGLITEKEIMALPDGQRAITADKGVCFTPLALDELRQRGIKLERTKR